MSNETSSIIRNPERAVIRNHQLSLEDALEVTITDLLRDQDDKGTSVSKADLILIFALYEGGIKEFYKLYKDYVLAGQKKNYFAIDKPHWFLKKLCD